MNLGLIIFLSVVGGFTVIFIILWLILKFLVRHNDNYVNPKKQKKDSLNNRLNNKDNQTKTTFKK